MSLGPINPRGYVAQLYPPDIRDKLQRAAFDGDLGLIDRLTDLLAVRGFVRPRSDGSRFESIAARNPWDLASDVVSG